MVKSIGLYLGIGYRRLIEIFPNYHYFFLIKMFPSLFSSHQQSWFGVCSLDLCALIYHMKMTLPHPCLTSSQPPFSPLFLSQGRLSKDHIWPWCSQVRLGRKEMHCTQVPSGGGTEEGKLWFSNALNDGLSRSCQEGTGTLKEGMGTETDWYFPFKYQIPWFSDSKSCLISLPVYSCHSLLFPYLILSIDYG